MKTNIILQGDALTKLKELPEKSINMCMTSPPYWALRDYGTATWEGGDENCEHKIPKGEKDPKNEHNSSHNIRFIRETCYLCGAKRIDHQLGLEPTFDEYINKLCDIFDEVKRVLRDDGTCWVNLGDTYNSHSTGKGDVGGIEGKRKNKKDNQANTKKQFNQIPDKCLTMIPMRFAIEMVNRGWILRNTIIWYKPSCMPSSVKDRFTVDFEYIFFFSKKKKYYFETQYEPVKQETIDRYKYGWDGNTDRGYPSGPQNHMNTHFQNPEAIKSVIENGRNKRTVWTINPKPFKEAHFAVFPEELCETPIKAGCPEGGIVLDPFSGAGTTSLVALKQNKKFIGIELNKEYIEIAEKRLKPFLEQSKLNSQEYKEEIIV